MRGAWLLNRCGNIDEEFPRLRCVGRPAALNRKLGEDHYLVEAEVTVSKVSFDLRLNAAPRLENRRQDDVS